MQSTTMPTASLEGIRALLHHANLRIQTLYPGESSKRQPIHTMYGGAQIYKADSIRKMGEIALQALRQYGPDANSFAEALGNQAPSNPLAKPLAKSLNEKIYARVLEKLKREPIEDFRID